MYGQIRTSLATPGQISPPFAGEGLVQVRVLNFSPCIQYREEHEPNWDHEDQLPLTAPKTQFMQLRYNIDAMSIATLVPLHTLKIQNCWITNIQ